MTGKLMSFEMIAIEEAEKMLKYGATDKEKVLAKVAIPAIKKQIPKKPTDKAGGVVIRGFCPNCLNTVYSYSVYCDRCGQAIDWSDEE